jgi:ArsR family transcriptional regulator
MPDHALSIDDYAAIFTALSEPTRLRMFRLIDKTEEMPCTRLIDTLGLAKSTISYHIKVLFHAGLIRIRKQGRNYFYTARRDLFDRALPTVRVNLRFGHDHRERQQRSPTNSVGGRSTKSHPTVRHRRRSGRARTQRASPSG